MKQPRRMEVHVEQVTFEDCKSAADMLCGTDEEIEKYAHDLEKKSGLYDAWDYVRDRGLDDTDKNFSPLAATYEIAANDWLCWILDIGAR